MDFSVLMSVYGKDNASHFREALLSVTINQIVKPKQLVLVEDGPVSESIESVILEVQKQDTSIEYTILKKEKNLGLAAALNSGIPLCKTEWIARMDSDDISYPDRFEKQVSYLIKHPKIDVLGGAVSEFEKEPGDIHSERYVGLTMEEIRKMAQYRTPMNHGTVMYKKSMVQRAGCYSENFGKLEDYKLWVDMMGVGAQFANLNDILMHFRVGNGFIARRSDKREIADWDMLQEYLLKNGVVNRAMALKNKIYIRAFIYMPGWMKILAYKTILRR